MKPKLTQQQLIELKHDLEISYNHFLECYQGISLSGEAMDMIEESIAEDLHNFFEVENETL